MKKNLCRTKIVATLGPASGSYEKIYALLTAGANVFRINYSHGSRSEHEKTIGLIRQAETERKTFVGILADLQGPKLRIAKLPDGGIVLKEKTQVTFVCSDQFADDTIPLPHPEIFRSLKVGQRLLMDDGRIEVAVQHVQEDQFIADVIYGGTLTGHKGVNLPDTDLGLPALTEKDRTDLEHALKAEVDWVALSFVQRASDIKEIKKIIQGRAKVIAKIEKPLAVQHLTEIIEESDAIMVARGDLGVELHFEEIPSLQKHIVNLCRQAGKPVIVATQMLESMVHSSRPTRAEASDVATAVYEGADAVMLSAESASGLYPVEAVKTMAEIIYQVEKDPAYATLLEAHLPKIAKTKQDAVTISAYRSCQTLGSRCILSFTASGGTAYRVSRLRSVGATIVGVSPNVQVCRQLCLVWGVKGVFSDKIHTMAEMVQKAPSIAISLGLVKVGESIIITAGEPLGIEGGTNVLRIYEISKKDF